VRFGIDASEAVQRRHPSARILFLAIGLRRHDGRFQSGPDMAGILSGLLRVGMIADGLPPGCLDVGLGRDEVFEEEARHLSEDPGISVSLSHQADAIFIEGRVGGGAEKVRRSHDLSVGRAGNNGIIPPFLVGSNNGRRVVKHPHGIVIAINGVEERDNPLCVFGPEETHIKGLLSGGFFFVLFFLHEIILLLSHNNLDCRQFMLLFKAPTKAFMANEERVG